ncbi:hypothetical protein LOTGIDRAFT_159061 [Lottia gigantea]|uniref:Telomeric repeat-binding factor 2-interacting protein 1 n=1 Tax=Lottia gigantea TaxID=225164 RepID=V4ATM5_LOTGI|nr:hypothetical protein LOTGIDRAFT_159061 [Lottia gigantea]ESO98265.1 hypothetical protein LOTGIDRAFT_159061 [Lottia gigantea]
MADKEKQPSENGQTKSQENGEVLDLDLEDAETIIKVHSSNLKGRKKYTLNEDIRILTYIATKNQWTNVTGTILWDVMERSKVTDHSWQSMKCRYLKYILPAIDNYDIPNSWKSLLTGDTSKALSDISSPTAVFKTNNNNQSKEGNSNFGLFGNHPPPLKKKRSSNVENVIEKTISSSPRKLSDPNCSAITSSTVTPSPPKSPLTNPTSTPKHEDACSKFVNIAMNLEDQIEEYDSREMSEDILEPNKSVDVSMAGRLSSGSEDEFDINLMKMAAENKSENLSVEVEGKKNSLISDNDSAGINVLSQPEETIQSESCLQDQKNNLETSDVICCDDEFDQNLIEKAKEGCKPTCLDSLSSRGETESPVERTTKRHTKGSSLRDFVANDTSELSTDETEESTTNDLTKVVEEFQNKYGINKAQIISVLWYFSGNVKNAMQWIEFGSDLSNLQPWCKGDDSLLTSTNERDINYLKEKYTAENIAERNLFFEEF